VSGNGTSSWPRRWLPALVLAAVAGLLSTACQGGAAPDAGGSAGSSGGASPAASKSPAAAPFAITPANGSHNARPDRGITVTAAHGKITSVTVAVAAGSGPAAADPVLGALNAAATSWHSTWALGVSQRYTVTASGVSSSGRHVTQTSSFRTLTPARTFQTMIFEGLGKTYGVGMPIALTFSEPIVNKRAVERALELRTSTPVVGAWYWDGSQTLDFRPRGYWPAHTRVSFTGHLDGVRAAPGLYGAHTLTQSFNIGASLIVVASTATHHMRVYRDGKLFSRWPISTGKPGDNTPNGTYLTIEKGNPVLMKGPGYRLKVPWSVRFTWSGDYLHDAFWSVGQQGFTNVSHGCVNMPPVDAKIYYKMAIPGDPVTVSGSPRAGVWDNGWTEWFLPWSKYLQGSALHEAVEAGPGGSSFVPPAALPASAAKAPLTQPRQDNWAAAS
jgi:lipoprotein-anchoring transpeptidase ErfK/SrfK